MREEAECVEDPIRDGAGNTLVEAGERLERVCDGFGFTEGPVWDGEQDRLIFSDIQKSRQWSWSARTGLQIFRVPSNQANGNALDGAGRLVTCEHASSQVVRHEHDGKLVRVIADTFDGKALNSPNDVIVDREGRIWFTDPTFGRIRPVLGLLREPELPFRGVFRIDPDGALHLVISDLTQPNGLCLSQDERLLYVNDSWQCVIRVYEVQPDRSLRGGDVFAEVKGSGEGVADGMKIDARGNLFCNGPGGIHIFGPTGDSLGLIPTPEKSANFCFGEEDLSVLYITASTSIYKIRTKTRGI